MTWRIRTRLTAVYCTVFCLCIGLLEAGAYVGLNKAIDVIVDRELHARLDGVEDFLNEHVSRLTLSRLRSELKSHGALQPEFLEIKDSQGQYIYQGQSVTRLAAGHIAPEPAAATVNGQARPLRVLSARRTVKQHHYDLRLATDLTVPFEILRQFAFLLLFSSPVVLACASITGYWVSGRVLAPVAEIAKAARSIGAADLSRRVAIPPSRDELQYLAETLNAMLSRIENAFRQISQFTADASHELRTPLAVIRVTAEVALLRSAGSADFNREALHRILSEAGRSANLLDDLLSLAQGDSGATALRIKSTDLCENVGEACERVALLAREKGLDLQTSMPEAMIFVPADPDHLRRLWLILLDNAIKYTSSGTIEVKVFVSSNGQAVCQVTDSGIGIAAADLPHIFERFFQADKSRDRRIEGSGLGLSIAKFIARAHEAQIEAESVLGSGTTLRVIFPHRIDSQRAGPSPVNESLVSAGAGNLASDQAERYRGAFS
jgi:heavy metal sensor kinase